MRNPNPIMHSSNPPYRSQLCILFQRGKCSYGENCRYAHSISDLRNLGFDTVANERHKNGDIQGNGACKSRPCYWSFSGKHCPYGERCHFLHKYDHVDAARNESLQKKSFAITVANAGKDKSGSEQYRVMNTDEDQKRVSFYNTRLCAKWERFGSCPYGVKCTYAHGETELETHTKNLQVIGEWKSQLLYIGQIPAATERKEAMKNRRFMKWPVEKIGRIYADWMDTTQ